MEACERVLLAKSAPELLSDSKNVRFHFGVFCFKEIITEARLKIKLPVLLNWSDTDTGR